MTYRGKMDHGVVVIEGEKPADGTLVDVIPSVDATTPVTPVGNHPALGIWKDRTDLPEDPVEASRALRERMMRRADG